MNFAEMGILKVNVFILLFVKSTPRAKSAN